MGRTSSELVIEPFDREHLAAIVECVTTVWCRDNVIARALGVTADDYRPVAEQICGHALADDLGMMLREPVADRVVGFYTTTDLVDELAIEGAKASGGNPRMQRWGVLLSRCLAWYVDEHRGGEPVARGEILYLNIGGVLPEYRGKGWIDRMALVATPRWTARGYDATLSIATHPRSIEKLRRLPFEQVLHELPFALLDDPDLSRLQEPRGVVVSVMPLDERGMPRPASPRPTVRRARP